jgi:hypothetical protein
MQVPPEIVAALASGKKPAVRVTLRGYTYRSTIASMGGVFMLPVSAEVRAGSGVAAGDEVEVEVELDTQPREVELPADFAEALNQDEAARRCFAGLSYSNQLRYVLSIQDAKTPETRQRRIAKSVSELAAGGPAR